MKLVAVSACTAGIAHTYMTQEAIEQECKKRGIDCKVETQGGMGINNELEQDEVDAADVVFQLSQLVLKAMNALMKNVMRVRLSKLIQHKQSKISRN